MSNSIKSMIHQNLPRIASSSHVIHSSQKVRLNTQNAIITIVKPDDLRRILSNLQQLTQG